MNMISNKGYTLVGLPLRMEGHQGCIETSHKGAVSLGKIHFPLYTPTLPPFPCQV